MNGKSKSILLQVAFKKAAEIGGPGDKLTARTQEYYDILINLHTSNNIDADDAPRGGGGGNYTPKPKATPPASAISFTSSSGAPWIDYRAAKIDGSVKPKFPDFKSADGKESVYEFGLNGEVNPAFAELVTAVSALASLTDPF